MYDTNYLDEYTAIQHKKMFGRIYPEVIPTIVGISQDKCYSIVKADFPDGTFYFRVQSNSVSHAYPSLQAADQG